MTAPTTIDVARENLASCERMGRFFQGLGKLYEDAAAKWEEFSGEQIVREVEALRCQDMVDACRRDWSRGNRRLKELLARQPNINRKDGEG